MENYLLTILSILMGMLIAAVTARKYYQKTSEDLKKEAKQLRHLNELMLRAMENSELAKFSKDKNGNIKGLLINIKSSIRNRTKTSSIAID
jgi:hypothetical protein